MTVEKLFIYATAHGADSIEQNLESLTDWGICPGFIGLELPEGGEPFQFRELFKTSPGTTIALIVAAKLQRLVVSKSQSNGSHTPSEYEAGRQFGEEIGATVERIDKPRNEIVDDYLSWHRRVVDLLFMAGAILSMISAVVILLIVALGLPQAGISAATLAKAVVYLGFAVVLVLLSFSLYAAVQSAFSNGIREARDEEMFSAVTEWGRKPGNQTGLVIAGMAHTPGLKERAEAHDISVAVQHAPSVEDTETDSSFGMTEFKEAYFRE
jgi:fumarate reductase subunit D